MYLQEQKYASQVARKTMKNHKGRSYMTSRYFEQYATSYPNRHALYGKGLVLSSQNLWPQNPTIIKKWQLYTNGHKNMNGLTKRKSLEGVGCYF